MARVRQKKQTHRMPIVCEETFEDSHGEAHDYEMGYFATSVGIRLKLRVGKLIRSHTGSLAAFQDGMTEAAGVALFLTIVPDLCDNILEAGGPEFLRELLAQTFRDGDNMSEKVHFEGKYAGNYGELYSAVAWVIIENFKSFFSADWSAIISAIQSDDSPADGPRSLE